MTKCKFIKDGDFVDEFETKVKILINIIEQKNKMLKSVYDITENQETLLKTQGLTEEFKSFFTEMSEEKQKYIDKILDGDMLFQKIFAEIDEFFEEKANIHKGLVKHLQEQIKKTTELDIRIRVIEQRNKEFIINKKNKPKVVPSDISKKNILNKYKQNKKN